MLAVTAVAMPMTDPCTSTKVVMGESARFRSTFPWAITRTGWLRAYTALKPNPRSVPVPVPRKERAGRTQTVERCKTKKRKYENQDQLMAGNLVADFPLGLSE
jgi:hypothetical protein